MRFRKQKTFSRTRHWVLLTVLLCLVQLASSVLWITISLQVLFCLSPWAFFHEFYILLSGFLADFDGFQSSTRAFHDTCAKCINHHLLKWWDLISFACKPRNNIALSKHSVDFRNQLLNVFWVYMNTSKLKKRKLKRLFLRTVYLWYGRLFCIFHAEGDGGRWIKGFA